MHLVQAHQTGRVRSTFSLTGTPTCSSLNAFPSSTTVRKGSTASMDSPKSAWRVSACGQERCNHKLIHNHVVLLALIQPIGCASSELQLVATWLPGVWLPLVHNGGNLMLGRYGFLGL